MNPDQLPPTSSSRTLRRVVWPAALLAVAATSAVAGPSGWRVLAPLPDPIGFSGMFAGVLGGRLVAGGGSQWDRPVWRKGFRRVSDRIFVLAGPTERWVAAADRLPEPRGHAATAASATAIFLAGGLGEHGTLMSALALSADGDRMVTRRLPDLPAPRVYAAGAVVAGRFWVVGGLDEPTGLKASREVWSLAVEPDGTAWRREADLPDAGLFVPATATDGRSLLVFGGMATDANGMRPSARAYRLDLASRRWERLPDLPEPRVGASNPCPAAPDGSLLLIGGYAEIARGPGREHPGFPAGTLAFDPPTGTWRRGPDLPVTPVPDRDAAGDPGPSPMMGAPAVVWRDLATVVSGEVRVSTRSPAVVAWPLAQPFRPDSP
ncbi:MAG TPA: kelch repeat-containing protein [Opitutaceae bacterium]|nr:kelch repeat-containing protein [Opitutaceae bacterium]